jgi:hypothetical protein
VRGERGAVKNRAGVLVGALLLALASVFLAWQIVKTAVVGAVAKTNPAAASRIASEDPRVRLGLAMVEFSATKGRVSPSAQQSALAALADSPLAHEPFLIIAVQELARGNSVQGKQLLLEARDRSPRSPITRLLLLDRLLREAKIEEAAAEMKVLARLIPEAGNVLVDELTRFARDEASRPALKRILASDPQLQGAVLARLVDNGAEPELILALVPAPGSSGKAEPEEWKHKLVSSLVKRGDLRKARELWARFSGLPEEGSGARLHDPAFKRLPGFPPFGWRFAEGDVGVAEPTPASSLQVEFYGRKEGTLAEQLLLLTPGRYKFSARVEGDSKGEGGKLLWVVACRTGNADLMRLAITGGPGLRVISSEFTVRPGCEGQWLRLEGAPAEFPKPQFVTIGDLDLKKVS